MGYLVTFDPQSEPKLKNRTFSTRYYGGSILSSPYYQLLVTSGCKRIASALICDLLKKGEFPLGHAPKLASPALKGGRNSNAHSAFNYNLTTKIQLALHRARQISAVEQQAIMSTRKRKLQVQAALAARKQPCFSGRGDK